VEIFFDFVILFYYIFLCLFFHHRLSPLTIFSVVAAGITPANQLAHSAGLEVDTINGGIVVNPELQIRSNLYAVIFLKCLFFIIFVVNFASLQLICTNTHFRRF
jgi:hypothetical protein